jgi:ubiquinone/menaquinone biosynthesis C-methylase UbiE
VRLTLCDRSETCLQAARQRAAAAGFEPVTTARLDATAEPLPVADLVTCSLFLHHLERGQVVEVLQRLGQATGRLLVINDLERSRGGLLAAWLACRLLTRSPIVRYDGPVSARAAWSRSELRSMAEEAGLTGATVASAPAWRMRLVWRRP